MATCGTSSNKTDNATNDVENDVEFDGFTAIAGTKNLFYADDTKVIYYIFSRTECPCGYQGYGYGYCAEYISINGHHCRYIDGRIVEVNDTDN